MASCDRKPRRWVERLRVVSGEPQHAELLAEHGLRRYLALRLYILDEEYLAAWSQIAPITWAHDVAELRAADDCLSASLTNENDAVTMAGTHG